MKRRKLLIALGAGALVKIDEPMLNANARRIAEIATRSRLVSIGETAFAEAGGLMGYGVNFDELFRRAAFFVDRILKGAKPGDIPFERPTKFELVVNLRTAKALGVTIPTLFLLARRSVSVGIGEGRAQRAGARRLVRAGGADIL